MNLLGYPRFTGDIDILLALDKENLHRMSELMKTMQYKQRAPVSMEELGDEKRALELMKEKNLIAYTFSSDEYPQGGIDVIVGESLKFDTYRSRAIEISVWGLSVPVVSIDDLISMKRKTDRKRDAEDVQALLELKNE